MIEINYKVNVPRERIYDLVVTGIESPYASALVHEGDWGQAWRDGDKGAHNAFGLVGLVDKYEYEESLADIGYKGTNADLTVTRLTDEALIAGLRIMASACEHDFHSFMEENDDALTGDIFIQCVMFKEVIYG
tara:strand:- start:99 stop:497 length:399 start_codon:yes stop_codon:yes gene_type:complete